MSPFGLVLWLVCLFWLVYRVTFWITVRRKARELASSSGRWTPAKALQDEEAAHTAACLAALTTTDVAVLQALGWEPPADIARRVEYERNLQIRNENYRRAVEAKQKREAAALMPYVPMTAEEMEAYKRRPLAERQAEANESITGDPTIHPTGRPGLSYADDFIRTERIDGDLHRVYRRPNGQIIAVR